MRKFVFLLAIAMLLMGFTAWAEDMSDPTALMQEGERIIGSINISQDLEMEVDMLAPKRVEQPIREYQMQRIQITEPEIRALLFGRTQPAKSGEIWEIWTIDRTECRQFIYQEEALTYATFYPPKAPFPLAEETPMFILANQQTQSILDAWDVPHEYPFYQVCNAARGADVSLRGTPFHTSSDIARYLLEGNNEFAQYEYEYDYEHKMYDDEYVFVRVRQQLNGIPFAISDTKSRYYRPDNPQFNEGVYLLLQYNSRGQIVYADACNLHVVVKEIDGERTVLGWQECLAALSQDDQFFEGVLEAKVIGAELCYAINEKHVTFPVWQFMVEIKQAAESSLQSYLCVPTYVDACYGNPL